MKYTVPIVLAIVTASATNALSADPPGGPPKWRLVWSDEFDAFDDSLWTRADNHYPTNNSQHAYLPEQVTVEDGKLVLTSENEPVDKLPYRSGQVISKRAQRLGRWEVRARLPTTRGMWPAIWLLPDAPWPDRGEIDIMENRGNEPHVTSSAFHWGTHEPYTHDYRVIEQRTSLDDKLVNYSTDFHTFAVEWAEDQVRFYVDDVHHTTFYNDEIGYFLPKATSPMRLLINTAIGGDFLPPVDESTKWPQRFEIDWVRVYERDVTDDNRPFQNGDFEAQGGTLAGWHVFGNRMTGDANIGTSTKHVRAGRTSLRIAGQSADGDSYSGVSQGMSVAGGDQVVAEVSAFVPAVESLAGTNNRVSMKIEFYNNWCDFFGGPAMLGHEELLIADGSTPVDKWGTYTISAAAPAGAVEARLSLVFAQSGKDQGTMYVDSVEMTRDK